MKVLVVSDSHGSKVELKIVKERHGKEVEQIIHCGDSELLPEDEMLNDVQIVKGNCDFGGTFPEEIVLEVGSLRLFVTHGHLYGIHSGLDRLYYKAQEVKADIVCFGHSHVYGVDQVDNTLFLNPGSVLLPRLRRERTYVILEIVERSVDVIFYELSGKELYRTTYSLQK